MRQPHVPRTLARVAVVHRLDGSEAVAALEDPPAVPARTDVPNQHQELSTSSPSPMREYPGVYGFVKGLRGWKISPAKAPLASTSMPSR